MYSDVKQGIITRMQTIDGLNAVTGYEPTSPDPPTMCVILDSFTRDATGQVTSVPYRFVARIYFLWQEFEQAELALDPFVNAVGAAIDADPQLGGLLTRGYARVTNGKAGWVSVGGVAYRILDTFIEAVDKAAYASGI